MGYTLDLDLGKVADATAEAAEAGINAVLADCVLQAKAPGYVPVDTGNLKAAIGMEPAKPEGSLIVGRFGVTEADVDYAIWQEIGYHVRVAGSKARAGRRLRLGSRTAKRSAGGGYRFIPGKFYLKRSAQLHFPSLSERIKEHMP